jgi:hypothetical protein
MNVKEPIGQVAAHGSEAAPQLPPYKQRSFGYLGLWHLGSWRLKAYGIHHDPSRRPGNVIEPGIVNAARTHISTRLSTADTEGHHHHAGFVIVHQGMGANWLLLNWWAYGDICCEVLARASLDKPESFSVYDGSAMACVHDLVVVEFERRVWVRNMLCENSSLEAYLAAHLLAGLY